MGTATFIFAFYIFPLDGLVSLLFSLLGAEGALKLPRSAPAEAQLYNHGSLPQRFRNIPPTCQGIQNL